MKAAVLEKLHEPLVFRELDSPVAAPGEVVVELKAAGLNHRDLWIQKGLYPGVKVPAVLGSDGAGVVVEAGDESGKEWIGKNVIINPAHNWGEAKTHYGPDFKILGLEDQGTFAGFIAVKNEYLTEMPGHLSYGQAAAIPLAGLTAWRSLVTRTAFTGTEKVLITGIGGGVAQFAARFAIAMGAEVWVTSGSDEKIAKSIGMGVKGGINYTGATWHRDFLVKLRAPRHGYFDVIIDSAGGPGFQKLIDLAAPGGRICFYGGTTGNITDLAPAKIFFKQLTISGSTMGTPEEFRDMTGFINRHEIHPEVDTVMPFDEINQGMGRMERGEQFGKIVFLMG